MRSTEKLRFIRVVLLGVALAHCGGGSGGNSSTLQDSKLPAVPAHSPVALVVPENQPYSSIIDNPALPHLNNLASEYGLATEYFANDHPSLPNYFVLTAWQTFDANNSFVEPITEDNMVRQLVLAGKTWKAYCESLPSVGYTGPSVFPYAVNHNPFPYFSDALDSPEQQLNLVPFEQFTADLAGDALPNFCYLLPNQHHNLHNCPEGMTLCTPDDKAAAADAWLETNLEPLVSSARFQTGGLLIITFDESSGTDVEHGGGHIVTVIVSPHAERGFKSTTFYQHESTLRLMLQALRVTGFPGLSSTASEMEEFFVQP